MGRGIVEPLDDFRVTNPPTNEALLDALAKDFVANGYHLKHTIRLILNSRAYQLSSEPNETNRADTLNYSHYYVRRLLAEELIDSMTDVTGVPEKFPGYMPGTRAMTIPQGAPTYFLQTFGRLKAREVICERDNSPDVAQAMHLISGQTIQNQITGKDGTLDSLARRPVADRRRNHAASVHGDTGATADRARGRAGDRRPFRAAAAAPARAARPLRTCSGPFSIRRHSSSIIEAHMYNDFDRRAFLKVGSLSLFGFLGYGDVLRLRAQSPAPAKRDIAVIHLLLSGGISQMDSWDPKPDADSKYRSQFKPIETNVSGIRISEHLPLTAKQADKFVIIRSMTHKQVSHESALALICSGHEPMGTIQFPAMQTVISKELGPRTDLPPAVSIPSATGSWEKVRISQFQVQPVQRRESERR